MASLDGTVGFVTGPGRIGSKAIDALSSDLARLITLSATGSTQQSVNQLNCIAVPFKVEKGIARSDAILVDTGRVTVRGTGSIDLREERIDLLLTPNPKDASLANYLAVPVHIGGTLANPSFTPDKTAVAKGVAGAVLGTAINPLSLLAPLVTGTGEPNACATGAAAKDAPSAAQQKPQPQSTQDAVRGKIEEVGRGIRSLFGR
jgi:hypothetical protein